MATSGDIPVAMDSQVTDGHVGRGISATGDIVTDQAGRVPRQAVVHTLHRLRQQFLAERTGRLRDGLTSGRPRGPATAGSRQHDHCERHPVHSAHGLIVRRPETRCINQTGDPLTTANENNPDQCVSADQGRSRRCLNECARRDSNP
jgi:hypothetical protein